MKTRFKKISHAIVKNSKYVNERVVEMGSLCIEINELLSEATKGNEAKLKELAKKCVEIGLISDSIAYELFLGNQITMEELDKQIEETIKKL